MSKTILAKLASPPARKRPFSNWLVETLLLYNNDLSTEMPTIDPWLMMLMDLLFNGVWR